MKTVQKVLHYWKKMKIDGDGSGVISALKGFAIFEATGFLSNRNPNH